MKSAFVKLESGSEVTDFEYTQLTKELVLMAWFGFFVFCFFASFYYFGTFKVYL